MFEAKVRRSYAMDDKRVLVLEDDYRGEIDVGETVEVVLPDGARRAEVATVAWGSAFHADSPPLTLVVSGLEIDPPPGTVVQAAR